MKVRNECSYINKGRKLLKIMFLLVKWATMLQATTSYNKNVDFQLILMVPFWLAFCNILETLFQELGLQFVKHLLYRLKVGRLTRPIQTLPVADEVRSRCVLGHYLVA